MFTKPPAENIYLLSKLIRFEAYNVDIIRYFIWTYNLVIVKIRGTIVMTKFKKVEVIETDDEGYLVLKGMLPEGSIVWSRTVGDKVMVLLKPNIGVDYILNQLMSLYRTLRV